MTAPKPQPGILDIAPYKGGEGSVPGVAKVHKLSSNESPIGPSPKAVAVYQKLAAELHRYPDGGADALRTALAKHYGLPVENIVCSNGSDEMISLICAAYCGPGDEVLYSQHGFLMYAIAAKARGATPVTAPETNYTADVDALLKAVTPKTRIVFLANPNNPTGTYIPFEEVRRLHAGLPKHVLLVLDAAYAEYVRRNDYEAGVELVAASENVVMTRTFSKIHGLAGLRIGWVYAPAHILDALNRVRGPFNVNAVAIAAGAAAVADKAHVEKAAEHNNRWLAWVSDELTRLGLRVTPSVGNFVLIHFDGSGKSAAEADEFLIARGFILRRVGGYGFPNALRMTIGTEEANRGVVAALKELLGRE